MSAGAPALDRQLDRAVCGLRTAAARGPGVAAGGMPGPRPVASAAHGARPDHRPRLRNSEMLYVYIV